MVRDDAIVADGWREVDGGGKYESCDMGIRRIVRDEELERVAASSVSVLNVELMGSSSGNIASVLFDSNRESSISFALCERSRGI